MSAPPADAATEEEGHIVLLVIAEMVNEGLSYFSSRFRLMEGFVDIRS